MAGGGDASWEGGGEESDGRGGERLSQLVFAYLSVSPSPPIQPV